MTQTGIRYLHRTDHYAIRGSDCHCPHLRITVRHLRGSVWSGHLLRPPIVDIAPTRSHTASWWFGVAFGGVHFIGRVCPGRTRGRIRSPRGGTPEKSILVVDLRCVVVGWLSCVVWNGASHSSTNFNSVTFRTKFYRSTGAAPIGRLFGHDESQPKQGRTESTCGLARSCSQSCESPRPPQQRQ